MRLAGISSIRFRFFAAFGIVALALWAAVALALHAAEREAMAKASTEGRNLARSLAEHVASSVRAIDLALLQLRYEWSEGSKPFASHVARQQKNLEIDFGPLVSVIAADGTLVYGNTPGAPRVDLSDREHFKWQKERGADELYVSAPILSRLSGQWRILFTRPIHDRRQQFAGVMALSLPPPALERVYNDIELGEGAAITLVRPDGQILAHSRDLGKASGVSLADSTALRPDAAPTGEYRRAARTDGVDRLYSYQKVPGYALIVLVGQSVDTVLAPYRRQRTTYLASGVLATALLLVVTLLLLSRRRDKEKADRNRLRLETQLRRSAEHLSLLFNAFPIAVAHVDKAQRITFANRIYQADYGSDPTNRLVREFVGESSYAALEPYIQRALAGEEVQFERSFAGKEGEIHTRWLRYVPDRDASGEVIGFFALREDITERKRAEEKIRKLNEELERRVHERTAELTAAIEALQEEVKERRLAETAALSLADRLQNMARRLGEAQEVERRRLAAELHDGVCSNLAAVGLNLVLLQKQLPNIDMPSTQRRLSDLITQIDEAKANARDISVDLRPLLLDERNLFAALEEYARKFEDSTGIAVEVKGAVAIELNTDADHLLLSIADDGVGIDLIGGNAKMHGLGLVSMQERADAIGGKWRIYSAPGKGTRVVVRIDAGARA